MRTTPESLDEDRGTLGHASLEQLDDAGQTGGDVDAFRRDTTLVEGTHGELRAGLTDGLGGDDADGFTEFDRATRWPANGRSKGRTRRARRRR